MKKLVALGTLALSLLVVASSAGSARTSSCQPIRAVFYTSSDWMRLAQGLAANPSPCAQYYISIAPVAGDKTQMRPNAAAQVRALGSNFHALAEVNYSAWQNWVTSTGNSWYAAGQEIRTRMNAAGFNIASGDTWVVNELSSGVRAGSGTARQNVRDLVHGLYDGDGTQPTQGMVFAVGLGQTGVSFPQYKATLESWLQDSGFWTDMSSYVSDFFQEAYGDVRDYAVAGADPTTRIGWLNAFLQHPLNLALAPGAPASVATARAYLSQAYGPLANASWAWSSDYGWTQVGSDVMADFVSAQSYAMRAYGSGTRLGFAWNPLNSSGLASADFNAQVGGVLARLAGSIHETDAGDPTQACEATGCAAVIPGGAPSMGWSTFSSWTPTLAAFTSASLTANPGAASGPLTVELETGGVPTVLPVPSTITLSSSSRTGAFASDPGGPWTPTLALTVPAGGQTATFYTLDSSAGTPTLTTSLNGQPATQTETVGTPVTTTTLAPPPAQVTGLTFTPQGDHMHIALRVADVNGNPLQGQVRFALLLGPTVVASTVASTASDGSLGLTALPVLARGCYSVLVSSVTVSGYAWDGISPPQTDCVTSLPAQLAALAFAPQGDHMHVSLGVRDDAGKPLQARVRLSLLLAGTTVASTVAVSGADGSLGVTALPVLERGCYSVLVGSVTAPGYTWDGFSPAGSDCVSSLPAHVVAATFSATHGRLHLALRVVDDTGHPLAARVSFAVLRGGVSFATESARAGSDGTLALTARPLLELGCYRVRVSSLSAAAASWDGASPSQRFCVSSLPAHVVSLAFSRLHGHLHVSLRVVDDAGRPLAARVAFSLLRGTTAFAATIGTTGLDGRVGLTARKKLSAGCYGVRVSSVAAPGHAWDRISPARSYCAR